MKPKQSAAGLGIGAGSPAVLVFSRAVIANAKMNEQTHSRGDAERVVLSPAKDPSDIPRDAGARLRRNFVKIDEQTHSRGEAERSLPRSLSVILSLGEGPQRYFGRKPMLRDGADYETNPIAEYGLIFKDFAPCAASPEHENRRTNPLRSGALACSGGEDPQTLRAKMDDQTHSRGIAEGALPHSSSVILSLGEGSQRCNGREPMLQNGAPYETNPIAEYRPNLNIFFDLLAPFSLTEGRRWLTSPFSPSLVGKGPGVRSRRTSLSSPSLVGKGPGVRFRPTDTHLTPNPFPEKEGGPEKLRTDLTPQPPSLKGKGERSIHDAKGERSIHDATRERRIVLPASEYGDHAKIDEQSHSRSPRCFSQGSVATGLAAFAAFIGLFLFLLLGETVNLMHRFPLWRTLLIWSIAILFLLRAANELLEWLLEPFQPRTLIQVVHAFGWRALLTGKR